MSGPAAEDIDYLCEQDQPHIWKGPDKNTPYDPNKLQKPERLSGGYTTYNHHPVSHGTCPRHAHQFVRSAQGYVAQRRTQRQLEEGSTTNES